MDTIVRNAAINDYEEVCKLFKLLDLHHFELDSVNFQSFDGAPRPRELFESYLTDSKKVLFVAQNKSELVGFANCHVTSSPPYPIFKPRRFVEVSNIFVSPAFQKHGLGKLLMNKAKDWAKSLNITTLSVTVYSSNERAVEFYNNLNFVSQKQSMELCIKIPTLRGDDI